MNRGRLDGNEAALAEAPIVSDRLRRLWKEFVQLATPYGVTRARLERWDTLRARARQDWSALIAAERDGQDLSELSLLKLLPYEDSPSARARGAFVHIAPAIRGDLRAWFEGAGWAHRDDWEGLGRGLFDFVRRCEENPSELWQACADLAALPGASAFDCGMLSPILNALRPDEYLLVNANGRAVLNHFAGGNYNARLVDYPPANTLARLLLAELVAVSLPPRLSGTRPGDLFEAFCHWMINEAAGGLTADPVEEPPSAAEPESTNTDAVAARAANSEPPAVAATEPAERPEATGSPAPSPASEPEAAASVDEPPGHVPPAPAPVDAVPVDAAPPDTVPVDTLPVDTVPAEAAPHEPSSCEPTVDEPADGVLAAAQAALLAKGQILLCGAPGSGRAALAERLLEQLTARGDGLRERLVFHPAWSYEDFIQRQLPNGGRRAGRFLSLCQAAAVRRDASVLIVHDVQRANVEAVLGEALTMLDQRGREVALCGGGRLCIPPNLLIIGTFDTSDASAPEVSMAVRQRFAHVVLEADGELARGEQPANQP